MWPRRRPKRTPQKRSRSPVPTAKACASPVKPRSLAEYFPMDLMLLATERVNSPIIHGAQSRNASKEMMMFANLTQKARYAAWLVLVALSCLAQSARDVRAVTVEFEYGDPGGQGFFDPVLGDARRTALEYAGDVWSSLIPTAYTGEVITVHVSFADLGAGTPRASTASGYWYPAPTMANTHFPKALANHLSGMDVDPDKDEITIQFNSNMPANYWYYGLDGNPPVDARRLRYDVSARNWARFGLPRQLSTGWQLRRVWRRHVQSRCGNFRTADRLRPVRHAPIEWDTALGSSSSSARHCRGEQQRLLERRSSHQRQRRQRGPTICTDNVRRRLDG